MPIRWRRFIEPQEQRSKAELFPKQHCGALEFLTGWPTKSAHDFRAFGGILDFVNELEFRKFKL